MVAVAFAILVLCFGLPQMDPTVNALRPRNSQAYITLDSIKNELNQKRDPLWLMISGHNEQEVANRVDQVEPILKQAKNRELSAPLPCRLRFGRGLNTRSKTAKPWHCWQANAISSMKQSKPMVFLKWRSPSPIAFSTPGKLPARIRAHSGPPIRHESVDIRQSYRSHADELLFPRFSKSFDK